MSARDHRRRIWSPPPRPFTEVKPGDRVLRSIRGEVDVLPVTAVDERLIHVGFWRFDRVTGLEVDEDRDWGPGKRAGTWLIWPEQDRLIERWPGCPGYDALLDRAEALVRAHSRPGHFHRVSARDKTGSIDFEESPRATDPICLELRLALDEIEAESTRTCEVCGGPGQTWPESPYAVLCRDDAGLGDFAPSAPRMPEGYLPVDPWMLPDLPRRGG